MTNILPTKSHSHNQINLMDQGELLANLNFINLMLEIRIIVFFFKHK